MAHPRLTPVGSSTPTWVAQIGPYGAWGDLSWTTRWGEGACGMYEASWTMPLPKDFEHPALRRNALVELMDGPWRIGSSLYISDIDRGAGYDNPWKITATGIGREVEGDTAWLTINASNAASSIASEVVDRARTATNGWRITGRDSTVPTTAYGGSSTTDLPSSIGSLLSAIGHSNNQRWLVDQDGLLKYKSDPTTPEYHVVPDTIPLGAADDEYATIVYVAYLNTATGSYARVFAPSSGTSSIQTEFNRREVLVDLTESFGALSTTQAQAYADGLYAKLYGRLGLNQSLTLTSNEILTSGGVPADLKKVSEDAARGVMVRLHGVTSELLAYNGQTYFDFIVGETKYTDGAPTIDIAPMGLAARDLASVIEQVTGKAAA